MKKKEVVYLSETQLKKVMENTITRFKEAKEKAELEKKRKNK